MNDAEKILQAIAGLTQKVDQQGNAIVAIQKEVSSLKTDVASLTDSLAHTNTAIETLATKK